MRVSRLVVILFLIIFMAAGIGVNSVKASEDMGSISVSYQHETSQGISSLDLIGVRLIKPFQSIYRLETTVGFGNISSREQAQLLNLSLYRRVDLNSDFDYYLGLNFDHFYDQQSSFGSGGKLTRDIPFITLKGINDKGGYSIYSRIGYAPLAFYRYRDDGMEQFSDWEVAVGLETSLHDSLHLFLEGSMGQGRYTDLTAASSSLVTGVGLAF